MQSLQIRTGSVSPELYRRGGQSVDCAPLIEKHMAGKRLQQKERLMDIIAIQIVATGALLVAHLVIVVRNRITQR